MPTVAPLPPADQLAGVLYRLADTSIPADRKVGEVQYATAADEPALKNFAEALADNGFTPVTVTATDLQWAGQPGHVVATITIAPPSSQLKPLVFPMEFVPIRDTWQLSRQTADQLLTLGSSPRPTPQPPG